MKFDVINNTRFKVFKKCFSHMGQKDQDGDYAEKCHIFFNLGV